MSREIAVNVSKPKRIAILGSGTRRPEMPPHLAELGNAIAVPELFTPRVAAFAGNPYDRLVVDLAYVEMAQRAEAAGCAAIFINTYADYGIEAMRAAVSIPVIGAAELWCGAADRGIWPSPVSRPEVASKPIQPAPGI